MCYFERQSCPWRNGLPSLVGVRLPAVRCLLQQMGSRPETGVRFLCRTASSSVPTEAESSVEWRKQPLTAGQASVGPQRSAPQLVLKMSFPSVTFANGSKCAADRCQNCKCEAETQSDIWPQQPKACLRVALTGNRFTENALNPIWLLK